METTDTYRVSRDVELRRERDADLYNTYLRGLRTQSFSNIDEAFEWCRQQPARKYYISAKSLVNYLTMIFNGKSLGKLHATTREKVFALYEKYMEHSAYSIGLPRIQICEEIVSEPAPKFYLTTRAVKECIRNERRRRRECGIF